MTGTTRSTTDWRNRQFAGPAEELLEVASQISYGNTARVSDILQAHRDAALDWGNAQFRAFKDLLQQATPARIRRRRVILRSGWNQNADETFDLERLQKAYDASCRNGQANIIRMYQNFTGRLFTGLTSR